MLGNQVWKNYKLYWWSIAQNKSKYFTVCSMILKHYNKEKDFSFDIAIKLKKDHVFVIDILNEWKKQFDKIIKEFDTSITLDQLIQAGITRRQIRGNPKRADAGR